MTGRGGPVGVGELSDCSIEGNALAGTVSVRNIGVGGLRFFPLFRADDGNRLPYADTNLDIAGTITDLLTLTFNMNLL